VFVIGSTYKDDAQTKASQAADCLPKVAVFVVLVREEL
jgi:hypothetical protein